MEDLFAEEEQIIDDGVLYLEEVRNGAPYDLDKYAALLDEYRRLLRQLRRVTRMSDRTTFNLNENNQDLTDKVYYDALTGIYNRRYLEDNLQRIIKSIARTGGFLSLLMIDIDYFKKYNDTYGHNEGDACLKSVANVIAESVLRPDDIAARYGGEEFTVILSYTDETGARYIAGKILENTRARNIPHENSEAANHVTVSIGITTGRANSRQTGVDYIKRADTALYQSKQNGRNRYTYLNFEEETIGIGHA
jgi:diguanylate cyclase (GGDEF)-like protein